MTTRLEKAINGLKQIADRYSRHDLFEFSNDYIKIKPKTDKTVWLWIYIILAILTPTGYFIYLLTQNNPDPLTQVLAIGLASYFGITLFSILRGQQTLTVDLLRNEFILENVHKTFTRQKKPTRIYFSQVHNTTLKDKALRYNNRWKRISFVDTNGNTLAYMDLGADFPDNIIAEKLKFFLGVVLWTYNEKKN
jgi:hypothetical protein